MNLPKPPATPQPTTKQIPAATDRALLEDVARTLKSQTALLLQFGERLVSVEENQRESERRQHEFEGRLIRNSSRVKHESDSNLDQEAKLADVIIWRQAVDKKLSTIEAKTDGQTATLAVIERVSTGWLKEHPAIGLALVGLILATLSAATNWLQREPLPAARTMGETTIEGHP